MRQQFLARALIVLVAFGLRLWRIDAIHFDHDHAAPLAFGIQLLDAVSRGEWPAIHQLAFQTGIGVPNPPGMVLFWGFVAQFGRDPLVAASLSAMLSVIAVALVMRLAARLFDSSVGLYAAFIFACSGWSSYFARGVWLQGQLELMCCLCAYALWSAVCRHDGRRMLHAGAVFALAIQTYLVAMGLVAQFVLTILISISKTRALVSHKLLLAAGAILASLSLYALLIVRLTATDHSPTLVSNRAARDPVVVSLAGLGTLDVSGPVRALAFVTSSGLVAWPYPAANAMQDVIDFALSVALGVGVIAAARMSKQLLAPRILLAWLLLPVGAVLWAAWIFPDYVPGNRQYMLLVSPAQYVLAGLGLRRFTHMIRSAGWLATLMQVTLLGAVGAMAMVRLDVYATRALAAPIDPDWLENSPLALQRVFALAWKTSCDRVVNEQVPYWQAALLGSSEKVAQGLARTGISDGVAWQVAPRGGDCLTLTNAHPEPVMGEIVLTQPNGPSTMFTYRSVGINEPQLFREGLILPDAAQVQTSVGLRLMGASSPEHIATTDVVFITHLWRIDGLPQADGRPWCMSLFVQWLGADGVARGGIQSLEGAPLPCSDVWRVGDYVLGRHRVDVPSDLPEGRAQLSLSLWDGSRQENAAFRHSDGTYDVNWSLPVVIGARYAN